MTKSTIVLLCAFMAVSAIRDPTDRPNIVMLFVDDLGAGDLGFTGHPTTHTPNIDALANSGMKLTTWYSGAPLCSASRSALMSGRQSVRVGVPPVFGPTGNVGMWRNETTAGQVALAAGYSTAICGKWHLGQAPEFMPGARGFQEYLGIPYSDDMGEARASPCSPSDTSDPVVQGAYRSGEYDLEDLGYSEDVAKFEKLSGDPAGSYLPLVYQQGNGTTASLDVLEQPLDFTFLSQHYVNFTTSFIKRNAHKPFFLYVPFSHVHTTAGNQPNKQYAGCEFRNTTIRGPFGDALAEVDHHVGEIVATLEALKLRGNTLILLTGDNGPWLAQGLSGGSQGLFDARFSGYLNTGKGATWEGGVREAGMASWPGVIAANSKSAELVSSLDLVPTIANLTNQQLPDIPYDGKNMMSVLLGGKTEHVIHFIYNERCVVDGKHGPCAARMGPYKAHFVTTAGIGGCKDKCPTVTYGTNPPLMFNVDQDPSEQYPLTEAGKMPTDPTLLTVIADIKEAYENEVATVVWRDSDHVSGAGPWGICCDRSKNCDCDGPPSSYAFVPAADTADQ